MSWYHKKKTRSPNQLSPAGTATSPLRRVFPFGTIVFKLAAKIITTSIEGVPPSAITRCATLAMFDGLPE